jgi:protein-S-isoprenylcysteine O-methyltransferase Ste14
MTMNRTQAAVGSAAFFLVAPGVVAGLVPWLLTGWMLPQPAPLFSLPLFVGAMLILAGLWVLIDSFVRFARGLGTPAPILPPPRLVVEGWYRYVRNPMYVAVVAIIVGQALVFWSWPVLLYGAAVFVAVHLFVAYHEEPVLRRQFPNAYAIYAANVRRWRPRLTPWHGS